MLRHHRRRQRARVRNGVARRLLAGLALVPHVRSADNGGACSEASGAQGDESEACRADVGLKEWTLNAGNLEMALGPTDAGSVAWRRVRRIPPSSGADDGSPNPCDQLHLGPLFEVALRKRGRVFDSASCTLADGATVNATERSVEALFLCPLRLRVHWRVSVSPIRLPAAHATGDSEVAGAAARVEVFLSGPEKAAPERLTLLTVSDEGKCSGPEADVVTTGLVEGSPVLAQERFFLALEHPLANNDVNASTLLPHRLLDARVDHLGTRAWRANLEGDPRASRSGGPLGIFRYTAVVGAFVERSQARRVFLSYLSSVRMKTSWSGPLVHYNSWYDFTSWQDEGFFGRRSARTADEAKKMKRLLKELQKDQMHEKSAIAVVRAYGEELVRKRGAVVDSFLWDDGWDDPDDPDEGLWAFDRERFPRGFGPVAQAAKNYSCGNGVWLSPWGGYGTAKENRLAAARAQGFETNKNGLSLAGPKYFERFKKAAIYFRREAGVNFFKFDGVAGDPNEVAAEIEGMLGISAELHTTGDGELWINLTTGTWPSPFFLLWVDSIWRGHTDTQVLDELMLPGSSDRQRWHAFRECIVYEYIARRAGFFPLARLMIHGVVLAQHGDARAHNLHLASDLDWAQEVWSFASMGLLLQELYVSPELMTAPRWDELAAALAWVRNNSKTLEDMFWAFPAGCTDGSFRPHGWAAWRGNVGFLTLRNLQVQGSATSPRFTLAEALELPLAARRGTEGEPRSLEVRVEKRLANEDTSAMHLGQPCGFLAGSTDLGNGACSLPADVRTQVELGAGELLILRASLLSS